jgi:hypothetical protein
MLIVIPGFLGGLVIALVIALRHRRGPASTDVFSRGRLSTDVINMSSIKVAGVGGLGLVAMALVVALNVERIGQSLAIGLVFGVGLAAALILFRRRSGPMPSSGEHGGANTVLAIDSRPPVADDATHDSSNRGSHVVSGVPAAAPHLV